MDSTSDWDELITLPKVKIGEGRFREVYSLGEFNVLKLLKPTFVKKHFFLKFNYPTDTYTKHNYGIQDFNQYEYDMYNQFKDKIPTNLSESFIQPLIVGKYQLRSASISELVKNQDGSIANSLETHGPVKDQYFWKKFNELEQVLNDNKIYLMDMKPLNILVKTSDDGLKPVLMDYKRFGKQTYPFQFWMQTDKQLADKMNRRIQRLKEDYKK